MRPAFVTAPLPRRGACAVRRAAAPVCVTVPSAQPCSLRQRRRPWPPAEIAPPAASAAEGRAAAAAAAAATTTTTEAAEAAEAAEEAEEAEPGVDAGEVTAAATNTGWAYAWPRAVALAVAVLWSSNFAAVKLIGQSVPPADGAMARFAVAAAVFAPALLRGPKALDGVAREEALPPGLARHGLVCGLWVSLGYLTQAVALQTTDAGKGAFICSLAVVFVPVVTALFPTLRGKGKAERPSWTAAALAVMGVALMELTGDDAGLAAGDVWALLMMAGFGMGFIENERALEQFPRHAKQLTALQLGVVATLSVCWAGVSAWAHGGSPVDSLSALAAGCSAAGWQLPAAVLYTGVITTAATIYLENIALLHVSAGEMAVILTTEPLFATGIAAVVLNERMGPGAVAGGALILAACLVNQVENSGGSVVGAVRRFIKARVCEPRSLFAQDVTKWN